MSWFARLRGRRREPEVIAAPPAPSTADIVASAHQVEQQIAGKVPAAVTARVLRITRTVDEMAPRLDRLGAGSRQAHTVVATATSYLPEAVGGYLRLPRDFADRRVVSKGKTSLMVLCDQLDLLGFKMDEVYDAVCKADVRWVFHSEVSESVDAYYQEIGRAGRDGDGAEAVLFYRSEDLGLRRFFAGGGHVELDEIARVLDAVRHADGALTPSELQDELDLSETKLTTAVLRLEEAGAVRVLAGGEIEPRDDSADAVRAAAETEEKRRVFGRSRVDMMRGYAETDGCRRAFILSYFGEPFEPPCGRCDNCEEGRSDAPPDDVPFAVGTRVAHAQWGEGVVQRYDDDAVVVLFDEVGYKTLALAVIRDRGILESA